MGTKGEARTREGAIPSHDTEREEEGEMAMMSRGCCGAVGVGGRPHVSTHRGRDPAESPAERGLPGSLTCAQSPVATGRGSARQTGPGPTPPNLSHDGNRTHTLYKNMS